MRLVLFVVAVAAVVLSVRTAAGTARSAREMQAIEAPYLVATFDHGLTPVWTKTPPDADGLFKIVQRKKGGRALRLLVTPFSYGPNPQGQMTAVSVHSDQAHAGRDAESPVSTWYRVKVRFPAGLYRPTPGEWNWLVIWHNDERTDAFPNANSIAAGVLTDYAHSNTAKPGKRPRLYFRLMGGAAADPQTVAIRTRPGSLRYNHWYTLLFHITWSPDPSVGEAEWWIDGRPRGSVAFPTLYTLPDGSHSYNGFGLYNYRLRANWRSEVDFDDVAIGPSRSSVQR